MHLIQTMAEWYIKVIFCLACCCISNKERRAGETPRGESFPTDIPYLYNNFLCVLVPEVGNTADTLNPPALLQGPTLLKEIWKSPRDKGFSVSAVLLYTSAPNHKHCIEIIIISISRVLRGCHIIYPFISSGSSPPGFVYSFLFSYLYSYFLVLRKLRCGW